MIVDTANNVALAQGQLRRIIENGDAQVTVPSVILPVLLQLQPTQVISDSAVVLQQSGIGGVMGTRTNQAAGSFGIMTVPPGLWEFEISLSSWFNFANVAGAFTGASIVLVYQGFTMRLLERLATAGSFTDYNRLRMLLESQALVQMFIDATGPGQSVDGVAVVNAIRIL